MRPRRPEAPFRAASDVRVREIANHLQHLRLRSSFFIGFLGCPFRGREAIIGILGLAVGDARGHFFVRVRRLWLPVR